jgi:hypothetical protein
MAADLQGQDPKTLWQDQEEETDPVTLSHIHDLARKLDRKAQFLSAIAALVLVACGFTTGQMWVAGAHRPLLRVDAVLSLGGDLGAILLVYRAIVTPRDPAAPISDYLRRRLQRGLAFNRGGWTVALLPLAPVVLFAGYVLFGLRAGPLLPKLAAFAPIAATVVFFAVRGRIRSQTIRNQLRVLDRWLGR